MNEVRVDANRAPNLDAPRFAVGSLHLRHVDEYGYTSMLLATVQEQQKQIDALKRQVDELSRRCK